MEEQQQKIDYLLQYAVQNHHGNRFLINQSNNIVDLMKTEAKNKVLDAPSDKKKQELVVLQDRNDPRNIELIRGQKQHIDAVKRQKMNDKEEVGRITSYMNPINLLNRLSHRI
jgi:hypothetical protein